MGPDRRSFLLHSPLGLLALSNLPHTAEGQVAPSSNIAPGVADFWVQKMGLSPRQVLGGAAANRARPSGQPSGSTGSRSGTELMSSETTGSPVGLPDTASHADYGGYGREPFFLYLDEDEHALIPAQDLKKETLHPSGDMAVDVAMERLRFNAADRIQFDKFSSGGIYLDVQQQHPQQKQQAAPMLPNALASSVLGAIFPPAGTNAKSPSKSKTPSSPAPAIDASLPTVALQQSAPTQSISLPNGVGKIAFSCFMKDRRKSAFGLFVSAFMQMGAAPNKPSFLPMLSLPLVAVPALTAMRTLVGNMQVEGFDHAWILQCGPTDVTCTADGCSNFPDAVRIRPGSYIAVPKEQSGLLKGKLDNLKVVDGFVVPRNAGSLDTYDAARDALPGITYLSLSLKTKATKLNGCLVSA
jgi:hypothetical protein